jgi:hypothetical protein
MTGTTQNTDLGLLQAVIARSPIVVASVNPPARHFADWCRMQAPADVDAAILGWIRSHVPARKPSSLS